MRSRKTQVCSASRSVVGAKHFPHLVDIYKSEYDSDLLDSISQVMYLSVHV